MFGGIRVSRSSEVFSARRQGREGRELERCFHEWRIDVDEEAKMEVKKKKEPMYIKVRWLVVVVVIGRES